MKHRGGVGPTGMYDIIGAQQFCVMVRLGLRESDTLLDFGCGSFRGGRLFIPYLGIGNYYGVEPNQELVKSGIEHEVSYGMIQLKKPHLYCFDDFEITSIGVKFDYILAQSILSHAGVDVFEKIIREASESLQKGGVFAATYFDGAQTNRRGWLGHGIATYPFGFVKSMAVKYGMSCKPISIKHPVGQKWVRFST